jgi:predicted metal-dependent phosphoesterase TrpH
MVLNTAQALMTRQRSARDAGAIAQVWAHLSATSCPRTYNFHLHTLCSDGQLHPIEIIQQAIDIGLQGLAITDHHTVEGYEIAQLWLAETRKHHPELQLPHFWTGVEITSKLADVEVHILGYGFDPNHEAIAPYLQGSAPHGALGRARRVIEAIHEAGGLAVLAHPERYRRSSCQLIPIAAQLGIDGVETYYAYRKTNPWQPTPGLMETVAQLARHYGLYQTCGTDSHGSDILLRL